MSEKQRDFVQEAVDCFIKGQSTDPTDPVAAIAAYFKANAREELKARAKAEGKTAVTCWKFIETVAKKALHGRSGHIDPVAVFAIAMHYFEDVPADWDKRPENKAEPKAVEKPVEKTPEPKKDDGQVAMEIDLGPETETPPPWTVKKAEPPKPKRFSKSQGFFFDMIETPAVGGKEAQDEAHE